MTPEEIFNKLSDAFGEDVVFNFDDGTKKAKDAFCEVEPWSIERVGRKLKDDPELAFDYLECLSGVDLPKEEQLQVVYHLYSYTKKHRLVLKASVGRDDPVLPTISGVWSAANWHERECYDLFGVLFDGHPDLRRVLLPEDWEGHPMRKDWKEPEHYHGIPTTRPSPMDMLAEAAKAAPDKADPKKAAPDKADPKKAAAGKADAKKVAAGKADAKKADAKADAKKADAKKADAKADAKKADAKADAKKADAKKADAKKADAKKADAKADDEKAES
ncbi:MAG: NADH-quinone oxidoreductase subunit C [Deltaproteobacteria bacterium]|jgi:NADH-quinone oxidoreductase subunit C|nr:NADH-quinone oxidoreductase subunit C [Deltaproteobacteria bacterium]MBW2536682.1 NADH-quinone oxidoreductase subunit C [Deltaproteobacteria bacterium]